jgi:uncharacterized damage-inducible protein DinB
MLNYLEKLFEHNHWANLHILKACQALSDEELDAEPRSATKGSIRSTLLHLVGAQHGYLRLLTQPLEERREAISLTYVELERSLTSSGEALLALVRAPERMPSARLQTRDGYLVDAWVLMVQIINHATEHREQIKSMLSALGRTPPAVDAWDYAETTHALLPVSK